MPSVTITSAQPTQILKARKRQGFIIQNLNSFGIWIRWDGNKNVTYTISDNENCGIFIGIGGSFTVTEGMLNRTNDCEVWGIADGPAAPANAGYVNFLEL